MKHRTRWSSGLEREEESKEIPTLQNVLDGGMAGQHVVDRVSRTREGSQG